MAPEPQRAWLLNALQGNPEPFPDGLVPATFARTVIDDAREEGVAVLLHRCVENANARSPLPTIFHAELKQHAQFVAAQELASAHEVQQVLALFAEQDIQCLLIKGTPLAYSLYPKPYLRSRGDTDILFPDRQTAFTAGRLLEPRGYQRPNAIIGETISTQFTCRRELATGMLNTFDMHWRLNNSWRIADLLGFDELSSRAEPLPQLHPFARTPCTVDSLIIACLHRIAHRPEQLHNRLIWLYDIHLLMTSFEGKDWDRLVKRSREKGITSALLDGLHAASVHFRSEIPEMVHSQLSNSGEKQSIDVDDYTSRWRREIDQMRALPSIRLKLAHVKANLFPGKDYLMKKYDTAHTMWIPWLYAKRIVNGLAKRDK